MNHRKFQILHHLYTFRFLSRNHIQHLLGHKHPNRIIVWLNELTQSNYLRRYYNQKTITIPAIYSLGLKSRKYLKQINGETSIDINQLDRIWREHTLSDLFRQHCLLVVDIYIALESLVQKTQATLHFYTKTLLKNMKYMPLPLPDAYFSIEEANGSIKRYFLDIFDDLPARMMLRKRVRQYFNYYEAEYWQEHAKPFPYIILLCPDDRSKNYLESFILKTKQDASELSFYLTTREAVKASGFTRNALTKVTV